LTYCKFW